MHATAPTEPDLEKAQALLSRLIDEVCALAGGKAVLETLDTVQIEADYERAWMMLSAGELDTATDAFGELSRRVPDQYRVQFGLAQATLDNWVSGAVHP
jgi:hypothetical protein